MRKLKGISILEGWNRFHIEDVQDRLVYIGYMMHSQPLCVPMTDGFGEYLLTKIVKRHYNINLIRVADDDEGCRQISVSFVIDNQTKETLEVEWSDLREDNPEHQQIAEFLFDEFGIKPPLRA